MEAGHVLKISTFEDVQDILSLCNLFELYNAFVKWGYNRKLGTIADFERAAMIRAIARQLVDWIFVNYEFRKIPGSDSSEDEDEDDMEDDEGAVLSCNDAFAQIYYLFLVHQARVLIDYKQTAWQVKFRGEDGGLITPQRFEKAIERCFMKHPAWDQFVSYMVERKTMTWVGRQYSVQQKADQAPGQYSNCGFSS